jgi:hypothetical protein
VSKKAIMAGQGQTRADLQQLNSRSAHGEDAVAAAAEEYGRFDRRGRRRIGE